jgi:hypothetical protein
MNAVMAHSSPQKPRDADAMIARRAREGAP